ncbi:leucine-rich repeat-containing protein 27 isoform X2 [Saccopteryx leptura]|uniref:leucine-rich repeat-containing protein 27 isoform X2 n=1 Tax=Saccopteryx leptura TaxID=249018 RepID=UPI00339BC98E
MEGTSPGAADPASGAADTESGAAQAGSLPASSPRNIPESVRKVIFSSSPILDLSQSGLHHLEDILKIPTLQQLHLQRNALCTIPEDFFRLLPNLTWLDLRHNRVQELPRGIGSLRYLKTLLLERNPIKMLPVELGNVVTLRALNLRHCPLQFPPQLVVQKGVAAILSFLRDCAVAESAARRGPASPAISPLEKIHLCQPPHPPLGFPEDRAPSGEGTHPPGLTGTRRKEAVDPHPPVETLDLSELRRSPEPWGPSEEDWPSEGELRRFWALRQEIVEKEQAEVLESQLLAAELPPTLQAVLRAPGAHPSPKHVSRKAPSLKDTLPSLASTHQGLPGAGWLEERAMALQELREKQALMERHWRDRRVLLDWREQAQTMKKRKEELGRLLPPRRTLMASSIPFTTDLLDREKMPVNPSGKGGQSKEKSLQASNKLSGTSVCEGPLKEQQAWHVRARREAARGAAQDSRTSAGDLETARKLQDKVTKLKSGPTLSRSCPHPAVPKGLPLRPPASQPQNIFSNTKY